VAHDAPRSAAALAFYTLLSLAPVLVVGIAISDAILPEGAARVTMLEEAEIRFGPRVAAGLERVLKIDAAPHTGLLGVLAFFFGATAGFASLRSSLNQAWGVEPEPGSRLLYTMRKRLLSFVLVLCVGVGLLLLTLSRAALSIAFSELERAGIHVSGWIGAGDLLLGIALNVVLIAVVYRFLPDAEIEWRPVIVGAFVTALLLGMGRIVSGYYVSSTALGRAGSAGETTIALLLVLYVSAMVFLFGAELTRAYAEHSTGRPLQPSNEARRSVITVMPDEQADEDGADPPGVS
jgi:membrane protein